MKQKKRLLILNRAQFGYHIDTYYYCKYLCDDFDVTYIGWDYKHPYLELAGVKVHYISRESNKLMRYINFIKACIVECKNSYDIVFIKYFPLCFIVKYFSPKNIYVLDIRTGLISENSLARMFLNKCLGIEARFFNNITVISSSLASKLGLDEDRVKVVPLGADIISDSAKAFKELKLLYVGTFHRRDLEKTIIGCAKFHRENKIHIKMNYIMIGSGFNEEEKLLKELVKAEGLEDIVTLLGPVRHDELKPYFDSQNIGVSFIPMTPYFDCQPPTKTFEYLLSGMPVIATSTYENSLIVNDGNGVLIEDSAENFCDGLRNLVTNIGNYNSDEIRSTSKSYLWENIIQNVLKDYLKKLSK